MRTNSFTNGMLKKSNTELQIILDEKNKYTDEAVQAVIWELENRNLIEKGSIKLQIIPLENQNALEEKKILLDNKKGSVFEELVLPELFSKKAILGFTIFFSTLFGAILLMRNLRKMNKQKARIEVLLFGVGYTLFTGFLLNYLPKMFFITLIFNFIGYLVLIEYFWNKNLGKDLEIRTKSITKPLLIFLLISVFFVLLLMYTNQLPALNV